MTKMERPQVLNEWDEAGQCFGNTAMLLDVQAPFHHVMKANRRRKPFLPLRVSKHSHLNRFRLQLLEQSRNAIEISFSNAKTEFIPTRTFWRNPLVGQNHRDAPHSHGIEQAHAGCAHSSWTKNELTGLAYFRIAPPILAHSRGV